MISFDRVSKSYRTGVGLTVILNDLDCDLSLDRNVGILGRVGAGKSTLIRMIAGSELPDRGRIRRQMRISFPLAHTVGLSPMMTGRENATFIARVYGADSRRVVRFVDEFSELGNYLNEPLRTYSNGMRARLAFGICIAIDFDVYLIDEVATVGDVNFKRRCMEVFAERRKAAKVLMVSQNFNTIRQYCDAGGLLADGQIQFFEDIDDAISAYNRAVPAVAAG